jgi:GrpB-like predicted nucleotidyltransferase (UPF0157 family)
MTETVRLMHYAPQWRQEFEQSKSGILQSCNGDVIQVEHIGSTAIPGLIARPVIDMIACVHSDGVLSLAVSQIQGLNYREVAPPRWCDDSVLLVKPRHGEPTHLIFLTMTSSRTLRRTIAVRDHLRNVPARAVEFEHAKVRRWKDTEGEPQQYERDKSIFFAHLEEQIGE